jgi:hypothetical protein
MTAKEIIEQAQVVVSGDRQKDYGHPKANHTCTAQMWSAWLSRKYDIPIVVDTEDVCWMNILQKASRQANKSKDDNAVDVVGYVLNDAMCKSTNVTDDENVTKVDESIHGCFDCLHRDLNYKLFPCCDCHKGEINNTESKWEPK